MAWSRSSSACVWHVHADLGGEMECSRGSGSVGALDAVCRTAGSTSAAATAASWSRSWLDRSRLRRLRRVPRRPEYGNQPVARDAGLVCDGDAPGCQVDVDAGDARDRERLLDVGYARRASHAFDGENGVGHVYTTQRASLHYSRRRARILPCPISGLNERAAGRASFVLSRHRACTWCVGERYAMKPRWLICWLAFALSLSACDSCGTGHGTRMQHSGGTGGTGMMGGGTK